MDKTRISDVFSKWSCTRYEYGALGIKNGAWFWSPGHDGGDGQHTLVKLSLKPQFDKEAATREIKALIRDLSQQPIPFPDSRYSVFYPANKKSVLGDYSFIVGMHHPVAEPFKWFSNSNEIV